MALRQIASVISAFVFQVQRQNTCAKKLPCFILLCFTVTKAFASSWTAEIPSSVTGLLGSCVVIPCTFSYPKRSTESTGFTGIWRDTSDHIVFHPDESNIITTFRKRTQILGDLRQNNCTLQIDPLQSQDTGPFRFRIEIASYDKFNYGNQVSITLRDRLDPIDFQLPKEVKVGEPVSASCSLSYFCPSDPPVFTWNLRGNVSFQSTSHNSQWKGTSTLTFNPARSDQHKSLQCNATFRGRNARNSTVLKVKYAPVNVNIQYHQSQSDVHEGEDVRLTCSSDGYPAAHSYQWHSGSDALLYTGEHYLLTSVSRHMGGLYCAAINTEGQGRSSPIRLNVLYRPEFTKGSACFLSEFGVTCVCMVDSTPASVVQWSSADGSLQGSEERLGSVTIATLHGELGSFDGLSCHASNTQGNATLMLALPMKEDKMWIVYITAATGAFVIIVLITAIGVTRKCKRSPNGQTISDMHSADRPAKKDIPQSYSKTRKGKNCSYDAPLGNVNQNEAIYGNIEMESQTGDETVYGNV